MFHNAPAALAAHVQVRLNAALPAADPTPSPTFGYNGGSVAPDVKEMGSNALATFLFIMSGVFLAGAVAALAISGLTKQTRTRALVVCVIGLTICGGAGTWAALAQRTTGSIVGS